MTARIPLKIIGGELSGFAPTDAVSADGIVPRSVTTLTLGDATTTGVSLTQGSQAASMLVGTADPSSPGVAAPEGSLYLRTTGGAGQLWIKTNALSTQWTQVVSGGSSSLQLAYNAGPGIIIPLAGTPVAISNALNANAALTLDRTFAGAGDSLVVTMAAATQGTGIVVSQNGTTNTGNGITVSMGAASAGSGLSIVQPGTTVDSHALNIAASGATAGVVFKVESTSGVSTAAAATISNAGSGIALDVVSAGPGAAAAAARFSSSGTGDALVVRGGVSGIVTMLTISQQGALTYLGGDNLATGSDVSIRAGAAVTAPDNGGLLRIHGGAATSGSAGGLIAQAGAATDGFGGTAAVTGGDVTSGLGGSAGIRGGAASAAGGVGGNVSVFAGDVGAGSGAAGLTLIRGGNVQTNANAGAVEITGGEAQAGTGAGGSITITGGISLGGRPGGTTITTQRSANATAGTAGPALTLSQTGASGASGGVSIFAGTLVPSALGVTAPEGSLYLQDAGTTGALYVKAGSAATAWQQISTVPTSTLQLAYNQTSGNTIVTAVTKPVALSNALTPNADTVLTVDRTGNPNSGTGVAVTLATGSTGTGFSSIHNGDGAASRAAVITHNSVLGGVALAITSSTTGDGTGNSTGGLIVTQSGSGGAVRITKTGTGTVTEPALLVDGQSTSAFVLVVKSSLNTHLSISPAGRVALTGGKPAAGAGSIVEATGGDAATAGGAGGPVNLVGGLGIGANAGGAVTNTGGVGGAAGAGGAVTNTGGAGGAGGVGGASGVTGGAGTGAGVGGTATVAGGAGGATATAGGQVSILGGNGVAAAAAGGAISITGGTGITSGAGGAITITGGATAAAGTGGAVTITSGTSTAASGAPGVVTVRGATITVASSVASGGAVVVQGGDINVATATGGSGGTLTLRAGNVTLGGGTQAGGALTITGGSTGVAALGGNGGAVTIKAGSITGATSTGRGGDLSISGGDGLAASTRGGDVAIAGGSNTNAGATAIRGADVTITGGSTASSAAAAVGGNVTLTGGAASNAVTKPGTVNIVTTRTSTAGAAAKDGPVLTLQQSAQTIDMFAGTVDPSSGSGVVAGLGSIYYRNNGTTNGELWQKTLAAATGWSPIYGAQVVAGQNANFNFTTFAPGTIICVASSAARTGTLPTPVKGLRWTVTDAGVPGTSGFATFNFTVARTGTERIAGVAANFVANTNLATLNLICDGTDWWLI